jgi:hypothetical protein
VSFSDATTSPSSRGENSLDSDRHGDGAGPRVGGGGARHGTALHGRGVVGGAAVRDQVRVEGDPVQRGAVVLADYAIMFESHPNSHPTIAVKVS